MKNKPKLNLKLKNLYYEEMQKLRKNSYLIIRNDITENFNTILNFYLGKNLLLELVIQSQRDIDIHLR